MLIHQGSLRYFPKKILSAPLGRAVFSGKFLAASSPNIKGLFRKKREKMWGLRIGGVRGGAVSSGGRCAVTGYLKGFLWLFLFENNVLFIRFLRIIFVP
ncbi:hypothetical protein [Bacteroides intestinalis]|uniref:hypothetical protein n=1 Tax=Bacteroides intestinalis TaxID=329854 RepID=UPI00189BF1AC|nr:hypothetical protein [Bacteroides intestinalis]